MSNVKNLSLRFGIIAAMDSEIEFFKKKFPNAKCVKKAGREFFICEEKELIFVKCGIGKVNAASCTQILCDFGVSFIINSGIAGGIKKGLKCFDFVVSDDVVQFDFNLNVFGYPPMQIPGFSDISFKSDVVFVSAVLRAAAEHNMQVVNLSKSEKICKSEKRNLVLGRIATSDHFVATNAEKEQIVKLCDPLCVEMEGAAVAQVATLNEVPFVIIRCISDMADKTVEKFDEHQAAQLSAEFVASVIGF